MVWAVANATHPEMELSGLLGCFLAAYLAGGLVMLSTNSLIELLVMMGLCAVLLLGLQFAGRDHLGVGAQTLIWVLLCGSVYAPLLAVSLSAFLFGDPAE